MPKVGMEPIRRKQIINAVLSCIAKVGMDKVTLDMVADKAHVSKGVVSYYFKNKHDLLLQSTTAFCEEYRSSVVDNMEHVKSAKEALLIVAKASLGVVKAKKDFDTDLIIEVTADEARNIIVQLYSKVTIDDEFKTMVHNVYESYFSCIMQIIEFGTTYKEFKVDSIESCTYGFMAFLEGLILYDILGINPANLDRMDVCMEYIENNFC